MNFIFLFCWTPHVVEIHPPGICFSLVFRLSLQSSPVFEMHAGSRTGIPGEGRPIPAGLPAHLEVVSAAASAPPGSPAASPRGGETGAAAESTQAKGGAGRGGILSWKHNIGLGLTLPSLGFSKGISGAAAAVKGSSPGPVAI